MLLVCVLLGATPFVAWTWRNWHVFHVFEPLAPRYANDPGEDIHEGWENWTKTWSLDFVSTYGVYWNVPDNELDIKQLPRRAFDSAEQYAETASLADDYNRNGYNLTPEIDSRFAHLAEQRSVAHPMRSHVLLPLGRVADMWLRPRVENLPIDLDWWVYAHHKAETRFAWFYAALNAFYLLLGDGRTVAAAANVAVDAGLHGAAKRDAADCCGSGSSLHARVLSHVVCAGWDCALPINELGLAVGLEGEGVCGERLIHLDV